jgi:hypothetical protein
MPCRCPLSNHHPSLDLISCATSSTQFCSSLL